MTADDPPASQLPFSIQNILRDDFPASSRLRGRSPREGASPGPIRNRLCLPYGGYFMNYFPYRPVFYYTGVVPLLQGQLNIGSASAVAENSRQDTDGTDAIAAEQIDHENSSEVGSESSEEQSNMQDEYNDQEPAPSPESDKCDAKGSTSNARLERTRSRRTRSHFTEQQLKYLETYFSSNKYMSRDERTILAKALDLTELQIRNWFQNKRYQRKHLVDSPPASPLGTVAESLDKATKVLVALPAKT